ncbi:MAG: hypothetical protein CL566_00395 [Alphaproteobacteria bacterium]|nr:hypothetical protein [Alphaproteobacteria bacterium]
MRLNVIDMPEHWPDGNADGLVHSVYADVLNLSFDDIGHLVLDARGGTDDLPGTARIEETPGLDFRRLVVPGTHVSMRAGVLRVGGSRLTADFRNASRTVSAIEPIGIADRSLDETWWMTAWNLYLDTRSTAGFAVALDEQSSNSSLAEAIASRVRSTVPDLLSSASAGNLEHAGACLARLIGAGPGLTPSGDDFTVGFLLGLCTGSERNRQLAEHLARDCSQRSRASTDISRHYLGHAAVGRFAGSSVRLADAVVTGAGDMPTRLQTVLGAGASSGSDTAFGILCGLAVGADRPTRIVLTALQDEHLTKSMSK